MAKKNNGGKGRPAKEIRLPGHQKFTIIDVITLNQAECCALTVRKFINARITDKTLVVVGSKKGEGKGRPRLVLQRA